MEVPEENTEGILLVNKPVGNTSFSLIAKLRKRIGVKKIGHAGTLDPFASGVMILLVGRKYTQKSHLFLNQDKEYVAELFLGVSTDTYDCEGQTTQTNDRIPTLKEIEDVLLQFQGTIQQVPPMFSAKKINGQKLYHLARQGKVIERQPVSVKLTIQFIEYQYPYLRIQVSCSKGTYIRSLAHDIGTLMGVGAHLTALQRTRSGGYHLNQCIDGNLLDSLSFDKSLCNQYILK